MVLVKKYKSFLAINHRRICSSICIEKDIVYSSCFPNHNTQLATYNPQHIVGLFSLSFIILL